MGYIRHELVIFEVSDYPEGELERVAAQVDALRAEMPPEFARLILGPIEAVTNHYTWYVMLPDGSKEGWGTSDVGDVWRARFKAIARYGAAHFAFGDDGAVVIPEEVDVE